MKNAVGLMIIYENNNPMNVEKKYFKNYAIKGAILCLSVLNTNISLFPV